MAYFAGLLNSLFGGAVTALLVRLGLAPGDPRHPIPNYVAGEVLVVIVLIVGALVLRAQLSVERPGKLQLSMEWVVEFTRGMADEVIGEGGRQYVALVATLGLFIVLCNLMGLLPTFKSPTAEPAVPLGCAVIVFLHYNYQGFRKHGLIGYLKQLCGPLMAIAFLMFPVEIFSNVLRMLSLTARLYANMLAGGLVDSIFTSMLPVGVPVLFMALHVFESLLQAYIFMILPLLYISLAVTEEH